MDSTYRNYPKKENTPWSTCNTYPLAFGHTCWGTSRKFCQSCKAYKILYALLLMVYTLKGSSVGYTWVFTNILCSIDKSNEWLLYQMRSWHMYPRCEDEQTIVIYSNTWDDQSPTNDNLSTLNTQCIQCKNKNLKMNKKNKTSWVDTRNSNCRRNKKSKVLSIISSHVHEFKK